MNDPQPAAAGSQPRRIGVWPDGGARFSETRLGRPLLKNIALDQKAIWTSPLHLRWSDADWLVPLAGVTAALLAADRSLSKALPQSPSLVSKSTTFSNYGLAAVGGAAGGLYLWGVMTHDDHRRETGLLSGEAAADAVAVTSVLQFAFGRQRPQVGDSAGGFWRGGTSFPSDHSAAAWAMASVIAHEYPGPLTKLLVYGLAAAVSASRVTGQDHFPSDVLVGCAIGWFVGQRVYRAHHDPELEGASWPTFSEKRDAAPGAHPGSKGSPYVPLDSWVYPAIERLAALGYVQSDLMGLRPWTRIECARMLEEAADLLGEKRSQPAEAGRLFDALRDEFAEDSALLGNERNQSLRLESIYTRITEISGAPLGDSYHFGQTIINDFGRPYGEGASLISGFSGWASAGRFALYVRGEYQHAPGAPAYSQNVRDAIAKVDDNPVQPAEPVPTVNQFDLLDTYALMNLDNWEFSFGKQSLSWGPGQSGSMILSDNADPVLMGRVSRTIPAELPGFLSNLGPLRVDLFLGKLYGHEFPANPLMHGEKLSIKPLPQWELGFSRTAVFSGVGFPLTLQELWQTYSVFPLHPVETSPTVGPGKRQAAIDSSVNLTNWLSVYGNVFWNDAIRRTAYNAGIYFPRIPRLPRLDLRAEYVSTEVPPDPGEASQGELVYWDVKYHDEYLNKGDLLGSWVGRQGRGTQFWSTCWLSPRSTVQLSYRHASISPQFIPQGGTLADIGVQADFRVRSALSVRASVQYERWNIPLLASHTQTDVATSFGLTYQPRWWKE
jgi:membrane-associated phospholipid phosphatase